MYINNQLADNYQEKAILCPTNCLLIAGAGAGKTFTIVGKINYLIENNIYNEKEILVISFTNKSIEDLQKKIKYNIDILTFHKLAMNILKDHQFNFEIASSNTLEYIIFEFFHSLTDQKLIQEILKYYKEYDYQSFLKSSKYKNLISTIKTFINLFKTNNCTKKDIKKAFYSNSLITKLILIVMNLYDQELKSSNQMDFDDLISTATTIITKFYKYKYIIIDEFQDTSLLRWNLVKKLLDTNKALIFAVGDDFQSIYHFSGCNVDLFLNFSSLIPNSTILKLKYTYRNSQSLIDIAGKFILKNKAQINKELISSKDLKKPIRFINYFNPKKALKNLIEKLLPIYDDILILERNNSDINKYITKEFKKENDYLLYKNHKIRLLTIHSSKGLEADVVILINLINDKMGFPSQIKNPTIIESINSLNDDFLFAEERRLFYVALTRTKNEIYLLTPFFNKSIFVKELKKIL